MAKRPRPKARPKSRPKPRPKATRKVQKKTKKRPVKRQAKPLAKRPSKKAVRQPKKAKAPIETLRTPPSSLDLDRTPSAARSGAKSLEDNQRRQAKFAALTAGDVDTDAEGAYSSGDEAPGGDNPTPDQNDVEDIGQAVGVHYGDNQELQGGEEVAERDKHRWENE